MLFVKMKSSQVATPRVTPTTDDDATAVVERLLPQGLGKYLWKDVCVSVTELRNGNLYDGIWDNGFPRGNGVVSPPPELQILDRTFQTGNTKSSMETWKSQVKKPGQMISEGHKNYSLMLYLQLGIRYSCGKHSSMDRDLKQSDFNPNEKFWTKFPPEFKWKDYCPVVFRHIRKLFQVDYIQAICENGGLRELSSPGKSGSFFYLTQDDRFMIKTVKKSEVKVLIKMLPSYYQHVSHYENSLVAKFYGVHCIKPVGGVKTRFVVMGNMLCSGYPIHRRYDLKGSSFGRTANKAEEEIDEATTLKDLDLNFVFRLEKNWFNELVGQIDRDCEFLETTRIMDYSLLVGIHFQEGDRFNNRQPHIKLGANMPARAERIDRNDHFDPSTLFRNNGHIHNVVIYFGIIDILQDYDISKKLEHAYKSLTADPSSISAVDPKLYSKRFRDFILRIFREDNNTSH